MSSQSTKRFLLLSLAVLATAAGGRAAAQTTAVRALALRAGEMPELFVRGAKDYQRLEFSPRQPAETVRSLAANPLPLYKRAMNEKGEETHVIAHKVKIPTGAREILLLGWTAGKDSHFVAIEDNFGTARFSDWLLINTGPRPVLFEVGAGAKPVLIAPKSSVRHRISAAKGKGATVRAKAPFGGKATKFYDTYWPVHPDKRLIVLFVDDGSKIAVKRISDKLIAPAAPAS